VIVSIILIAMKHTEDEKLREYIAVEAMQGFLSNPQFTALLMKVLKSSKVLRKGDRFFDVVSAYSCLQADSLLKELNRTALLKVKKGK